MNLLRYGIIALILASLVGCSDKPFYFDHMLDTAVKLERGDVKGSGTLIGSNLILTAKHAAAVENLTAQTFGGVKRKTEKVWESPDFDVAVLKMDGPLIHRRARLDCDNIEWLEQVQWIGNPLILDWNYGQGFISTPTPNVRGEIAVSGPVNPGDSGAGMFSDTGQVRGVAVAVVLTHVGGFDGQSGIGVMVPSGVFCKQLIAGLEKDFPDFVKNISKR